jgi:tRNA (guanine-N7-)-methyltransferase
VADKDRFHFRSSRGRADLNPYVEKVHEYAPYTLVAEQAEAARGRWRELAGVDAATPLILEIGSGNGFFFRDLALRHPEALLVAVEVRFKRVWLTARKARQAGCANIRVVHHHAGHLPDLFERGEVDAVHLNHPDPWPKERHHKNRLLAPGFRDDLERHLRPGGEIWLKSDFADYGPLARELFGRPPWTELAWTADLHGEPSEALRTEAPNGSRWWAADVVTNYERKSLEKGCKIMLAGYRLDA